MKLNEIKGFRPNAVTEYMATRGLGLWNIEEKNGGLLEATYLRTAAGVTIEEVTVLFGRDGRAGLFRRWEASEL